MPPHEVPPDEPRQKVIEGGLPEHLLQEDAGEFVQEHKLAQILGVLQRHLDYLLEVVLVDILEQDGHDERVHQPHLPAVVDAVAQPLQRRHQDSIRHFCQYLNTMSKSPTKIGAKLKDENRRLAEEFEEGIGRWQREGEDIVEERYEDGTRYKGQLLEGAKDGVGIYYQADGTVLYFGHWKDGEYDGQGTYLFSDGERYQGELQKGLRHGFGKLSYRNGIVYEGDWQSNLKSGVGLEKYINGDWYEGDWKDNQYHGKGTMVYLQQTHTVQGLWRKGSLVKGVLKTPNYEGEWSGGGRNGKGSYVFEDGSKYIGEWMQDQKNGFGTLTYASGDNYEGEFKNGLKHGQGKYHYQTGDIYQGEFFNDLKHGNGAMLFQSGEKYQGGWQYGVKFGNGRYSYQNREFYQGGWALDRREGKGEYITPKQKIVGKWKNDLLDGNVDIVTGDRTYRVKFQKGRPILDSQ